LFTPGAPLARQFVVFDSEPYLEGCYQKLFGASAGEAMRVQLHGAHRRYAVHVPIQVSLGEAGLARFLATHEELLPAVRRILREHGIVQLSSFLFQPPAVSKPSLLLQMQIPATLQADEALPQLLQADKVGTQWDQLLASVHDTAASRSNPWWSTITQEIGANTSNDAPDDKDIM
jgi:L-rhamnose mutarotase